MAVENVDSAPPLSDAASRVLDCARAIVAQELELARLEVVEKLPALGRDLVSLALSALLVILGAILAILAVIWALADYVFGFTHVWASFGVVAVALLLIGAFVASGALRRARKDGLPLPARAIRQARALGSVRW